MRTTPKIVKAYTRHYRDNDSLKAYVEWSDGARTKGDAHRYHGLVLPSGIHMGALFDRAIRDGITIRREVW